MSQDKLESTLLLRYGLSGCPVAWQNFVNTHKGSQTIAGTADLDSALKEFNGVIHFVPGQYPQPPTVEFDTPADLVYFLIRWS